MAEWGGAGPPCGWLWRGNIGIGGGTRGTEGAAGPAGRGGAGGAGGFGVRWKGGGASWSIPGCELMSIIILIITAVGGTPNPRSPGSWEGGYKGCPWVRDTQACATFPGAGIGRDTQAHARFLRVGLDYPRLTSHSQELGGGARRCSSSPRVPGSQNRGTSRLTLHSQEQRPPHLPHLPSSHRANSQAHSHISEIWH